mmetsp:Transcript_639/g.1772  ORF Transcript_639/g.1772 Transcript_639/m.1772 type:complete len:242 (+) Transcript_639:197-922(+)
MASAPPRACPHTALADAMACTRSLDEITPRASEVSGEMTTRWWTRWAVMAAAASESDARALTSRGSHWGWRPRSQWPRSTSSGTCSTKARSASRGVTMPTGWVFQRLVTITQFWLTVAIFRRASPNVAPRLQEGKPARGFATLATLVARTSRRTSGAKPMPQRTRAKSKEERMPAKFPLSSATTKWWQAISLRACDRMRTAASRSVSEGRTVESGKEEPGKRARPLPSHALTAVCGDTPPA